MPTVNKYFSFHIIFISFNEDKWENINRFNALKKMNLFNSVMKYIIIYYICIRILYIYVNTYITANWFLFQDVIKGINEGEI